MTYCKERSEIDINKKGRITIKATQIFCWYQFQIFLCNTSSLKALCWWKRVISFVREHLKAWHN